jgi:hypothetical protein
MSFFYCYDMKLFDFLKNKGFKYILKARHYKTNDLFSMYHQSNDLNDALDEWRDRNNTTLKK